MDVWTPVSGCENGLSYQICSSICFIVRQLYGGFQLSRPSGELSCQCHPKMEDTHKGGRTSNGTKPRKKGLDAEGRSSAKSLKKHMPDAHDDATTP